MIAHEEMAANCGVSVFRDAFSTDDIAELLQNLDDFRAEALKGVYGVGEPQFNQKLDFNKTGLTAHLYAIDPITKDYEKGSIWETSLFRTIRNGKAWPLMTSIFSTNVNVTRARIRIVDHQGGAPKHRRGALFFHQEKWALRNQKMPSGHNLWMCLNPDGQVANLTTPGLQFALGDMDFWRQDHATDYYESVAVPRIRRLNELSRKTVDRQEEFVEAENYVFYRPHLRVGDIVVFDHHVLHASFVPASATKPRVSCEFRVYPNSAMLSG